MESILVGTKQVNDDWQQPTQEYDGQFLLQSGIDMVVVQYCKIPFPWDRNNV